MLLFVRIIKLKEGRVRVTDFLGKSISCFKISKFFKG